MALVITRKPGQSFTIGNDITITVLENTQKNSKAIRLAIDAPKELSILRDDIKRRDQTPRR